MLIIICGLPGSGKSTLAQAVASRMRGSCISTDIIRKIMFKRPEYSEEEKAAVYRKMSQEASDLLGKGSSVILDGTFYKSAQRENFLSLARETGAIAKIIKCELHEQESKNRIEGRKGGPSDADYTVFVKIRKEFEPIKQHHLAINSALPIEERVRLAMDFIGEHNG